jgi:hypothetical protein
MQSITPCAPEPALSLSKGLALFETWDSTPPPSKDFVGPAGIFHHNQPVSAITDFAPARCDNHLQPAKPELLAS